MGYWEQIKYAFSKTSIYEDFAIFSDGISQFPQHICDLLAAHWILSEVMNGGFHQFFENPTGLLAPEAAQGFENMGLPDVGKVIRLAMAHFDVPYPREQDDRWVFLDSNGPEIFEPLEQRLYEIGSPNLSTIYDVMDKYATQNALRNKLALIVAHEHGDQLAQQLKQENS